jgi:hypothetical protein
VLNVGSEREFPLLPARGGVLCEGMPRPGPAYIASAPVRRRGRPPGPKNRSADGQWFNAPAARSRLSQIDRELDQLRSERALLTQILGQITGSRAGGADPMASLVPAARRGRPRNGRPSMLDLLARVISGGPANKGWTVGELRDQLLKIDPARASAANASALISSALVQALRAKSPRFTGSKGGRGHARQYRLAAQGP